MLEYNEITGRKFIIMDGEPYEVLTHHVFRKQQRKPVNATKLRNVITGRVVEHSFSVSDKVEEADLPKKDVRFLYTNRGEFWFTEMNDPSNRFKLEEAMIGAQSKYLKANSPVQVMLFEDKVIGVKLPIKMEFKVVEAPPAVKGDTAKGGSKQVKLENGTFINTPLFINEGDVLIINTETEEYVERA